MLATGIARTVRAPRETSLLREGFGLMRERWPVYLGLSFVCAFAGWLAFPHSDMYATLVSHPLGLVTGPPVNVVLALALGALFFVLPSALRRIEPTFKMTALRAAVTAVTILSVGAITEIGYAFAVVPGIVFAVLLSQALIGALLRTTEAAAPGDCGAALIGAVRGSIELTKRHFATTLGVITASLFILVVPFTAVLLALAVFGVRVPSSLTLMAPVLFMTFIYFECVRYALIVRWYRRLAEERRTSPP